MTPISSRAERALAAVLERPGRSAMSIAAAMGYDCADCAQKVLTELVTAGLVRRERAPVRVKWSKPGYVYFPVEAP